MPLTAIEELHKQIKYQRPRKLSDPHGDFSEQHLVRILATPDHEHDARTYIHLFNHAMPAGYYSEVIYFLPYAFKCFANPDIETDLAQDLIGYISEHTDKLRQDQLLETVRECLHECFQSWTRMFRVVHYDREACLLKGWGNGTYMDDVKSLFSVIEAVHALIHFKTHADLADEFIRQLAHNDVQPVKAAWFLAFSAAEHENMKAILRRQSLSPMILSTIQTRDLLANAAGLVRQDMTLWNASPTYWYDTFDILSLDDFIYLPEDA